MSIKGRRCKLQIKHIAADDVEIFEVDFCGQRLKTIIISEYGDVEKSFPQDLQCRHINKVL